MTIQNDYHPLKEIHEEIAAGSWKNYFVEGWEELKRRHTPCALAGIKVAAVAGGIFAGGFIATSMMFAGLAFKSGVEVWQMGEIPYVIGHWSEWSIQAFFTTMMALQIPSAVSQLGRYVRVNQIFKQFLNNPEVSQDVKEEIYKEKLVYEAIQRINVLFYNRSLPDTRGLEFEGGRVDEDLQLQEVYDEIEEVLHISRFRKLKAGFEELSVHKKKSSMTALKILFAGGALFFTLDYVIYLMGIGFSGKEAIADLYSGVNPNVGGHTLEWTAEMLAIASFIYEVFSELAHVGKVRLITSVFHKKIQENPEHRKRLNSEMKRQFRMVPEGYFFRLPTYLLFKNQELSEILIN